MKLQDEIDKARKEIRTDGYPVSIGEWMSIYEKKEIDIHPEFQRFFRWTENQKSRLIESILLGIPIPPIFVAQRADGVWDVVDGLQRLSTIFQFVGILRDESNNCMAPLALEATKYLPSLKGMTWENNASHHLSITQPQRLLIKRAKIDVSIIQKESDKNLKYELFQRLNTGGSHLSDQELRNSILVMLNPDFYRWIRDLSKDTNFVECIGLSDRATDEQYDMELVLRFITFFDIKTKDLINMGDLGEYLTDKVKVFAQNETYDRSAAETAFRTTFDILKRNIGDNSFRRFDQSRSKHTGGFSVSAFEVIALGVGFNHRNFKIGQDRLQRLVADIWKNEDFLKYSGSGIRASSRVPRLVPMGRKLFRK